jgi:membrane protease YdiL (CAAX protease family)
MAQPGAAVSASPPAPDRELSGWRLLRVVGALYLGLVLAGWAWLWWRDRLHIIGPMAVGDHGPGAALLAGCAAGFGVSVVLWTLSRYVRAFAGLEAEVANVLGPLDDTQILFAALVSGAVEEFFFRCAAQDAIGLVLGAVLFGMLHLGPGRLRLGCIHATLFGLLAGTMVAEGLGLLSAAVAHALVNYISLHRILPRP